MSDTLLINGTIIDSLRDAINSGEVGINHVPGLMKRIIKEGMWKKRYVKQLKETVEFDSFVDFVTTPPFKGLGEDLKLIEALMKTDREALDLWTEVTTGKPGGDKKSEDYKINVSNRNNDKSNGIDRPVGTTKTYALRKLRKDAPEIHQRVIQGDLSPHAGMIEAGFRKKTITIPIEPSAAAKALLNHFQREDLLDIMRIITDGLTDG